jgi:cell division protein ZapE
MADGPLITYRQMVRNGDLKDDSAQRGAIERLQLLHMRLSDYDPKMGKRVSRGIFGWGREAAKKDADLNGLYIYGGVGRGKSMLMDLFFETAPVTPKRRVHFHAFMQEIHAGMNAARKKGVDDAIEPVAEAVADSATLLCFDEIQITDITDAMIVGRLFEKLFARGVVIVATSNRHPDELYKNGLNRDLFLPFIALIKDKLDLHHLDGPEDHRQALVSGRRTYLTGRDAAAEMDELWSEIAGEGDAPPLILTVQSREVVIPAFRNGAGRASFADLCAKPLGPADYLEIARRVSTLFIDDIPRLGPANNNEAKRFVTLIDALYEAKTRLICSAAAGPEALYEEGEGAFEFERTASRLREMQGANWGAAPQLA